MSASPAASAASAAPRNILIVRLSALGDVALSSGLIPSLRARWPGARLSWLIEPAAAPLLRGHPDLDELLVLPRAEWKRLWREGHRWQALQAIRRYRRELRTRGFDLVVDPQGLFKSGVMAWMSGAARRVSLQPREGNALFMTETVKPAHALAAADAIISHEYRALARHLGAPDDAWHMDLAIGPDAREAAARALQDAVVTTPYAVLAAFTTRPQKHWIESRWPELAAGLQARGLTPVLLGGPGDADAAGRIAQAAPGIGNLAGRLPLNASLAVIQGASLLIGVDTGLTHMGIGLDVPTVALFGSTAPYRHGGSARTQVLYDALPCSPCHRTPSCGGRFDCMQQLDLPRVLQAADAVRAAVTP